MYLPKIHEVTDRDALHQMIRTHSLGCLITSGCSGLTANHIPFLIDSDGTEHGTLRGHVARANPVWQDFSGGAEALVVFQGPDAYISPNWYPSKHETGKAVPTWNYATVHAHGTPRIHEDATWLMALLTTLTDTHERTQRLPWKLSDAPQEYLDALLKSIVGIEIPISRIQGKWKVSQNRSTADRHGVAAGLKSKNSGAALAISGLVNSTVNDPAR